MMFSQIHQITTHISSINNKRTEAPEDPKLGLKTYYNSIF